MEETKLPRFKVISPVTPTEFRQDRVTVASDTALRRTSHVQRLAIATAALEVSRRELLNHLADEIYGYEGLILQPNGAVFEVPDTLIDDVFEDPDGRWLSDFLAFAETPPRQRPQLRILPRLRLIDLYFRIKHPERARLIAE